MAMNVDSQLGRIRDKLATVAGRADLADTFGARRHGFQLEPALSLDTVRDFESTHGIDLPPGYRRFLTELGGAGAGPSYGLVPLHQIDTAQVLDSDSHFTAGRRFDEEWWDSHEDEDEPLRGTLEIVHHGCTSYSLLVVTGEAAGRVVNVDHNGQPAPYMCEDRDFLGWYERWLDELAAGYAVSFFGYKIPGDEKALLDIVAAESDPGRRQEAIASMRYLPRLSDAGAQSLSGLFDDPDPLVRAEILSAITTHHAPIEVAERGVDDPDSTCRARALAAVRFARAPRLGEYARGLLHDADREVRWQAMLALDEAGEMTQTDLAGLRDHPDSGTRVSIMHFAAKAVGDPSALFRFGLADPEPKVRRQAVQGISGRGLREFAAELRSLHGNETDSLVLTNIDRALHKLSVD